MESRTPYIERIVQEQQANADTSLCNDFQNACETDPVMLSADLQAGVSARLSMALGFANDEYRMELEEGNPNAFNIVTEEYAAGRTHIMALDGVSDVERTSMLRDYDNSAGEYIEVQVLDAAEQIQAAGNTLMTQLDTLATDFEGFDMMTYMQEQQANGGTVDMVEMQKLEDASHANYIEQIRPIHDQIVNLAELAQTNGVDLNLTEDQSDMLEAVTNYDLAQEEAAMQAQESNQGLDNTHNDLDTKDLGVSRQMSPLTP